jgi:hypothetical protein
MKKYMVDVEYEGFSISAEVEIEDYLTEEEVFAYIMDDIQINFEEVE